jgi:hypothetical protein
MRGKNRFGLLAGLAVLLLLAFASAALAKPGWVSVKYTGCKLLTGKNTKVTDGNHRKLVLYFDVINNSKSGDIITAIYDRKISYKGVFTIHKMEQGLVQNGVIQSQGWRPATWNVSYSGKYTNPIKGEWYPGQVYKYDVSVPLNKLIKPFGGNWKKTNEAASRGFNFKPEKLSFDFEVRSHK